jgi:hypothetical protein
LGRVILPNGSGAQLRDTGRRRSLRHRSRRHKPPTPYFRRKPARGRRKSTTRGSICPSAAASYTACKEQATSGASRRSLPSSYRQEDGEARNRLLIQTSTVHGASVRLRARNVERLHAAPTDASCISWTLVGIPRRIGRARPFGPDDPPEAQQLRPFQAPAYAPPRQAQGFDRSSSLREHRSAPIRRSWCCGVSRDPEAPSTP